MTCQNVMLCAADIHMYMIAHVHIRQRIVFERCWVKMWVKNDCTVFEDMNDCRTTLDVLRTTAVCVSC